MGNLLLLLIFELILFFFAFIFSNRDILAPSVMMCSMFIISTVAAFININNWTVSYESNSWLIISSGIFVFVMAENLTKVFMGKTHTSRLPQRADYESAAFGERKFHIPKPYLIALLLLNIIGIVWYFIEIRRITSSLGIDSSNMFAGYRRFYGSLSIATEADEVEMVNTLLSQLLKITKGAGYICLYYLIQELVSTPNQKWRVFWKLRLAFLNVVLSVLPSLMLAGRNDLIQMLAAWLVYYYILWHQYRGWHYNISWKYVRLGLLIVLIGIPAFYGLLFLLGRSTPRTMLEYASLYMGSSIALFNEYLVSPVEAPAVFGEETLLGVHQILYRLGIPTFVKNRHLEYRFLSPVMVSNVYTFFRRPLHDFGLAGMYLFTALVAVFFAWFYYGKIKDTLPSGKRHFSIIIYGYLYYWIIYTSIDQRSISMISSTTILIFVIIYLELYFMRHVNFVAKR